jgi:hypothetical protein
MAWMSVEDALSRLLPQGRASPRLRKDAPVLPPETPRPGYRDGNTTVRQELRLLMEHHLACAPASRKYWPY